MNKFITLHADNEEVFVNLANVCMISKINHPFDEKVVITKIWFNDTENAIVDETYEEVKSTILSAS